MINYLKKQYSIHNGKEHTQNFGQMNKDKCFYVIRRLGDNVGLCSYLNTALGHIKYALSKGYIPIVDMQYYKNTYLTKEEYGRVNAWEYFFKQPVEGVSIEEVYNSFNVIMSCGGLAPEFISGTYDFYMNKNEELSYWKRYFNEYIHLSSYAKSYVDKVCDEILGADSNILGVICRGTDYVNCRPKGHQIQPSKDQLLDKIKEIVDLFGCKRIFLATEDMQIYNLLKRNFGDMLLTNQNSFINYTGKWINDDVVEQVQDIKKMGMDYLAAMVVISKCDYLIASGCNGAATAALFSEGHKYEYYWNLGVY